MGHNYDYRLFDNTAQEREHRAWLTLSQTKGLNLTSIWTDVDFFQNSQEVLEKIHRCYSPNTKDKVKLPSSSQLDKLEETADKRGERILTPADDEYPTQLLDLPQPPAAIFVAGQRSIKAKNQIAIIGSRLATPYGMSQAAKFSRQLAQHGFIVTSGLARGIDAQAHRGALQAQGRTIAVIGCGLDICYPREHISLQRRIVSEGNIISEYAYGQPPNAWHFPARNRLIAALTMGTIIVQASKKSGALITANIANDLSRDVMVVPGAIDVRQSAGCLQLMLEGANPVRHVRDIYDVLQIFTDDNLDIEEQKIDLLSNSAQVLLANLDSVGANVDTLVERCHIAPGIVAGLLNQLQVLGLVQRLPDSTWIPI